MDFKKTQCVNPLALFISNYSTYFNRILQNFMWKSNNCPHSLEFSKCGCHYTPILRKYQKKKLSNQCYYSDKISEFSGKNKSIFYL